MGVARWLSLSVSAAALLAGGYLIGWWEGPYARWVQLTIATAVAGGALVLIATALWRPVAVGRTWIVLVLLAGATFRVAVLPASRGLSDDAARYHWDGKVLAQGINPYRFAPSDPELDRLRGDPLDGRINHAELRTVYPPLAQYIFALGYRLSPGRLTGLQALALGAEILTWILLWGALRRRGLPGANLLLVAWSPLLMIEGYLPCHVDLFGMPFLVLFLRAAEERQALRAGALLALACLIKPLPLIFLPAILRWVPRAGRLRLGAGLIAVIALGYAPFLGAGEGLIDSLWVMARYWSFNGSLAAGLEFLLPAKAAHAAAAVSALLLIIAVSWKVRDLRGAFLLVLLAWVICTPVLFPWYLIWVVPFLVLRPDPALLALTVCIPLTEEVVIGLHTSGAWQPARWPWIIEYGVFALFLALGIWRGWGAFRRGSGGSNDRAEPLRCIHHPL